MLTGADAAQVWHTVACVTQPAGAYLAACPVVEPRHAATGLLLAGLAHQGAAAGGRFAPEALNFVTHLLADAAQGACVMLQARGCAVHTSMNIMH